MAAASRPPFGFSWGEVLNRDVGIRRRRVAEGLARCRADSALAGWPKVDSSRPEFLIPGRKFPNWAVQESPIILYVADADIFTCVIEPASFGADNQRLNGKRSRKWPL